MSGTPWWDGTRLVAGRAAAEVLASKPWRIVTAIMLLLGLAVVVVPRVLSDQPELRTLAVAGTAPPSFAAYLDAAARSSAIAVQTVEVDDAAAARDAVVQGDVDAALTDEDPRGTLYAPAGEEASFAAVVASAYVAAAQEDALAAAGLSAQEIREVQGIPRPRLERLGEATETGRLAVGVAVGIVLYVSLMFLGQTIATAVATEKSTRMSEVLLVVLRPTQLLTGTVLGVGLLGLVQIATLAVPATVGLLTDTGLGIPPGSAGDIALAVGWFVLGAALYAFEFAALWALVDKPTEVGTATLPVSALLIGSYLLAVVEAGRDPSSPVSVAASFIPFSAPLVMPVR
jgi:ABC-2 type transport system permease protein